MKVQVNKWLPEEFRFQGYDDALILHDVFIDQHSHHNLGVMVVIYDKHQHSIRHMEGASFSFHGLHNGMMEWRGYVRDPEEERLLRPSEFLTRELWIVLDATCNKPE